MKNTTQILSIALLSLLLSSCLNKIEQTYHGSIDVNTARPVKIYSFGRYINLEQGKVVFQTKYSQTHGWLMVQLQYEDSSIANLNIVFDHVEQTGSQGFFAPANRNQQYYDFYARFHEEKKIERTEKIAFLDECNGRQGVQYLEITKSQQVFQLYILPPGTKVGEQLLEEDKQISLAKFQSQSIGPQNISEKVISIQCN